jgi:hypothetical protein
MRWSQASEGLSPETEEYPLSEDDTKQRSEDRDWEHYSLCDSDLYSLSTNLMWKCPMNQITNPNPFLYSVYHVTILIILKINKKYCRCMFTYDRIIYTMNHYEKIL